MSRSRRLFAGAVSVLFVGLCAPEALALDDPTPTPTVTPTPTPTPTPSPSPGLLPVRPSPSPTPVPTPSPTVPTNEVSGKTADPRFLPDLRLAGVGDLRLVRTPSKRLQLRYTSTLLNDGARELKIRAVRKKPRGKFTVAQRIRQQNGRWTWRKLPVGTVYAGDGHTHQHLKDIVRYRMYLVDSEGNLVREDKRRARKIGFCIYDNVRRPARPGQPKRPVFRERGCGTRTSTKLSMGLSVGWGDRYDWRLPGQYVSLAGLPSGRYTLLGEANPEGVLYEQKTKNNGVFVEFKLRRKNKVSIKVLRKGSRPADTSVANVSSHDESDHPEGEHPHPDVTTPAPGAVEPPATVARPVRGLASRRRGRLTTRHGLRREHP